MADAKKRKTNPADLAGGAICLVLLAAGGFFVLNYGLRETQALSMEQRALAVELGQLTETAGALSKAEALLAELRANESDEPARKPLPAQPDFDGFYAAILALAGDHAIDIARVQPARAAAVGAYAALPVSIELAADFSDFYAFLGEVLQETAHCKVVDMQLTGSGAPGRCAAVMNVQLFGLGVEPGL